MVMYMRYLTLSMYILFHFGACTHMFEIFLVLHDLCTMIHFCILFISLSAFMIWIFVSDSDIYLLLFYIVSEAYISPCVYALSLESLYRI